MRCAEPNAAYFSRVYFQALYATIRRSRSFPGNVQGLLMNISWVLANAFCADGIAENDGYSEQSAHVPTMAK